jgi:hypothetical protein
LRCPPRAINVHNPNVSTVIFLKKAVLLSITTESDITAE